MPNNKLTKKMQKAKTDLIKMLETLSATMGKSDLNSLNMRLIHIDLRGAPDAPPCGYAACVIGEQAIQFNFDVFPSSTSIDVSDVNVLRNSTIIDCYGEDIVEVMDGMSYMLNCEDNLTRSIYDPYPSDRYRTATETGLFNPEELISVKHLHYENPTPSDAKEYIDLLIEKVKTINVEVQVNEQ